MQNNYFQFKKFNVFHEKSSMKVGTDAVLLACLADFQNSQNILEIGCGSGVISLIAAQNSNAKIRGIDIHKESVEQANENFKLSKWRDRIIAEHISLQNFAGKKSQRYDFIISNPPFFENSMKSSSTQRNLARHNDSLSFLELLSLVKKILTPEGTLSLVLPKTEGETFIRLAIKEAYFLKRKVLIYPKKSKDYNRIIFDLCLFPSPTSCEKLIIREENNEYTQAYRELTSDFYLAF